jgi:predicted nucleic acid-binding protein
MPDTLVMDASAGLAVVLREPERHLVKRQLGLHRGVVLVPAHFWLEVANALGRRRGWPADEIVTAFRELDELGLQTIDPDRPTLLLTVDLVARHGLTSYDAAYLALAQSADADLLTLDADLAAAAGTRSVLSGMPRTRRLHEELAPYETATTWANHGRYLAELRRAAAG